MYKYINWWSVNRCDKQTWPTWFRQHVGSPRNFKINVTSIKPTKSHNHHLGDCSAKCEAKFIYKIYKEHIEMSINHQNNGLTTSCNYLPECFWCIITLPGSTPLPMTSGPRNHFLQRKPSCKLASEGQKLRGLPGRRGLWVQSAGSNKLCWRHYSGYWCGGLIMFFFFLIYIYIYIHVLTSTRGNWELLGKNPVSRNQSRFGEKGRRPCLDIGSTTSRAQIQQLSTINHQSLKAGNGSWNLSSKTPVSKMSHLKSLNLRCLLPANPDPTFPGLTFNGGIEY